jgi:hypothetical protein
MTEYELNKWVSEENRVSENRFPSEGEMYEMIDGRYIVEEELSLGDYVDAIETYGAHSKDIAEVMTQLGFDDRPMDELTLEVSDYRSENGGRFVDSHTFEREMDWDRVQALREIIAQAYGKETTQLIPQ